MSNNTQAPKGNQLVTLPGGLDGENDAALKVADLALLVRVDPAIIGLRCVKGEKVYTICDGGRLEEVRA